MNQEQKLIDIMYQVALISSKYLHNKSDEDIATWVTKQLHGCGFSGEAAGSSRFVLEEER